MCVRILVEIVVCDKIQSWHEKFQQGIYRSEFYFISPLFWYRGVYTTNPVGIVRILFTFLTVSS